MDERVKTMIKWLENEVKGKRWTKYFNSYGYKNIAIYGAGELGKMLMWAMKDSEIAINCVIDRRAHELKGYESYSVYTLDEFLSANIETDAIVVTAISAYDDVLKCIVKKNVDIPILFLRDMVYEL